VSSFPINRNWFTQRYELIRLPFTRNGTAYISWGRPDPNWTQRSCRRQPLPKKKEDVKKNRKKRFTFDSVAKGVDAECDGYEKGKDLLGGTGGPSHEARDVEERIEDQEERWPETYTSVHGVEIQLEILADAVDHCERDRNKQKGLIHIRKGRTIITQGRTKDLKQKKIKGKRNWIISVGRFQDEMRPITRRP
jgi:hypothetical protein